MPSERGSARRRLRAAGPAARGGARLADVSPSGPVLVVGDANLDLVLRGDVVPRFGQAEQLLESADLTLGGSAALVASGLARLGVEVALCAAVGDDLYGRHVLALLEERGVGLSCIRRRADAPTGLSVVLSHGERSILTHLGAIDALAADDLPDLAALAPAHVHVASPYLTSALRPALPDLLAAARAAGASTSLDSNDDPSRQWDRLASLLAGVDVALPNQAECLRWAAALGTDLGDDWRAAARALTTRVPAVVVKAGAEGGLLVRADGEVAVPAPTVTVVDTTGAGDAFDAGWIAARLEGCNDRDALARAVVAGALTTRAAGGVTAQPDPAEVAAALSP